MFPALLTAARKLTLPKEINQTNNSCKILDGEGKK
jgi:hypothetical protein